MRSVFNKVLNKYKVVHGEITSVVYLTGEGGKHVEVLKNPTPYAFRQVIRHLFLENYIRGVINSHGDIWIWNGNLAHDSVQAQLDLGKCTQFVIANDRHFGVVQYATDEERKVHEKSCLKNSPCMYETNPNLKRLGLVFREEEEKVA